MSNLPFFEEDNFVYLVFLSTGEYEDYCTKNIGVFNSQERAIDVVNQYNQYFEENKISPQDYRISDYEYLRAMSKVIGFNIDYTGVVAHLEPVKLLK